MSTVFDRSDATVTIYFIAQFVVAYLFKSGNYIFLSAHELEENELVLEDC